MKYSYPKRVRLFQNKEFKHIFSGSKTKRVVTSCFKVYYCNNTLEHPRLGIVVTKKKVKKAVARNYLKRVIREFFRLNLKSFNSYDLVFLVNKPAVNSSLAGLAQDLHKILEYFSFS